MITSGSFRQIMGCFATGVAVATARDEAGAAVGLTVNSLTSVSLDPPLVLFCLDRKAHLYPVFKTSKKFAFNFLAEGQEDVSRHFADRRHNPRPKNLWDKPKEGCPILQRTLGWIICHKKNIYRGGDHDVFVGEVFKLHRRSGHRDPLLFFHGRYRRVG